MDSRRLNCGEPALNSQSTLNRRASSRPTLDSREGQISVIDGNPSKSLS